MSTKLARLSPERLPPILAGAETPQIRRQVHRFYASVAQIFESWINRHRSAHTKRAYRQDVLSFAQFLNIKWPAQSHLLLAASIRDVQSFRTVLMADGIAPKSFNRRIASISSFYKYLAGAAAEMRLPIVIGNPAHSQFIARENSDPKEETKALTGTKARQLMHFPSGESVIEYRDRAILKLYLYSGIRLATGCRLKVSDFNSEEQTVRLHEKGDKRRTIGIHIAAADALREYITQAGISAGPLFRPQLNPRSQKLASRAMAERTMYRLIMSYLERLPGAMRDIELEDKSIVRSCIYTPHSLRATTATLLLDAAVDIRKVQDLLGHRHITTTQIYDKRRISTTESASHDVPI
jgi:site-specific recombinase XerD